MSVRSLRYNTIEQHFTKGITASTDRDALAFLEAAQIYNTNQQRAIVNLVRSLKRVGLWSKMKAIYPFVGGTASAHKWNLKDPRDADAAFRLTFSGGWTHSNTGVLGNGTNAFADTFLQPATHLSSNNTHTSIYSRTNQEAAAHDISSSSGGNGLFQQISRYRFSNVDQFFSFMYFQSVTDGINAGVANSDSRGHFITSRTSATSLKAYRNSVQLGNTNTGTETSFSLCTRKLYLWARNNEGTADGFNPRECAFATIGDGLTDTDATNLYNIVDLYQKRLGRNV